MNGSCAPVSIRTNGVAPLFFVRTCSEATPLSPFAQCVQGLLEIKDTRRHYLLQSERMQGFAADPVYAKGEVFAYVGLPQNLKDLKEGPMLLDITLL